MALVTVRSFRDPVAAELAKSLLESRGIPAFVFDQHVAGINWFYTLALGGVRVKVDASDLEAAREALRPSAEVELEASPEEGEEEPGHAIPSETAEAEELVHERGGYPVRAYLLALIAFLILWYVRNRIRYG